MKMVHTGFCVDGVEERQGSGVLAAVQRDAYAIVYVSEALQNDKEVVLAAVQNEGGTALRVVRVEERQGSGARRANL